MTIPQVEEGKGRRAWTPIGKDNGSRWYEYIPNATPDGAHPEKDVNYRAVSLGVGAIIRRVNAYGYTPRLSEAAHPMFGPRTSAGVRWVQHGLGLKVDGKVGPVTAGAMFRDIVTWFAVAQHVPAYHLWGMFKWESGFDPGAVGGVTPDQGFAQINPDAHPDITPEEAYDPVWATQYAAVRLGRGREMFDGKGAMLQDLCSIAQHNSPKAARQWYEIGWVGPDEGIAGYVSDVLEQAATY